MPDRRQGASHVSPLQFWLGIAVSISVLGGLAIKVGQWTGRVDMSVQQLTSSVADFKATAEVIVREHGQMRMDTQSNKDKSSEIERRVDKIEERRERTSGQAPGRMFDR